VTRAHLHRDGSSIRVSSFCTAGTCVGVGWQDGDVQVVDTKNLDGATLSFTAEEWRAFVAGVKAGEFDRP
jgi:hypothetical protein